MLGVLFKCAHADLMKLFPREVAVGEVVARRRVRRHPVHLLQLVSRHHGSQRSELYRSLFGLVKIWNVLPTSSFQSRVTALVREAAKQHVYGWQAMLSPPIVSHVLLRFLKGMSGMS